MNYFESDNSKIAMKFLGQKDGILFYGQRRPDDSPETATKTEMLVDTIKIFSSLALKQNRKNDKILKYVKVLENKIEELYGRNGIYDRKLMDLERNNIELEQKLLDKSVELEAIKSSTCWKLTRPLRSIMHFIRK